MKNLFLLISLNVFFTCFGQNISSKFLVGKWEVKEVQLDIKAFDDSNIANFNKLEDFFSNVTFSFSKNGLVKISTNEEVLKPFNNNLFNTVFYYNVEENILNIGSWKKASNVLYIQVMKDKNSLFFNFSGGLFKVKKVDKNVKLKIDKNSSTYIKPFLDNKPLLYENIEENEETVDKPFSTYNCSHLVDNSIKKKCVSMTIINFFNRKFNVEIASSLGLSGRLMNKIHFTINKEGNVVNIKAESKNPKLSKEIIKTINRLPKFIPAEKNGKPINSKYSFPFIFQIQD